MLLAKCLLPHPPLISTPETRLTPPEAVGIPILFPVLPEDEMLHSQSRFSESPPHASIADVHVKELLCW